MVQVHPGPAKQIEVSQIIIHRAHQPNIVVDFFDADGLAGEDRAEIDFFVPQTDAAAVGNHAWIVYQAIFWRDSYIAIVDH